MIIYKYRLIRPGIKNLKYDAVFSSYAQKIIGTCNKLG